MEEPAAMAPPAAAEEGVEAAEVAGGVVCVDLESVQRQPSLLTAAVMKACKDLPHIKVIQMHVAKKHGDVRDEPCIIEVEMDTFAPLARYDCKVSKLELELMCSVGSNLAKSISKHLCDKLVHLDINVGGALPDDTLMHIGSSCVKLEVLKLKWCSPASPVFKHVYFLSGRCPLRTLVMHGEVARDGKEFDISSALAGLAQSFSKLQVLSVVPVGEPERAPDRWWQAFRSLQSLKLGASEFVRSS